MLGAVNRPTANSANHRVDASSPYTSGACATPSVRANSGLEHQRAQVPRAAGVALLPRDGALEQAWREPQLRALRGDHDRAEVVVGDRRDAAGPRTRRISARARTCSRTYINTAFAYTTSKVESSNGSS